MLKLGVFGNRSIEDKKTVLQLFFAHYSSDDSLVILSGGAAGPSSILAEHANMHENMTSVIFKPWTMVYSKLVFEPIYFYLRNKQIIDQCDEVVVFSNGEKDSEVSRVIDLCERKNKKYVLLEI